jgi:pyruvate/2-oxoglutarate/acetoin dehydrogenase E1 component
VAELTYRGAIAHGIAQEMRRDPSVVLIGEDVGAAGGVDLDCEQWTEVWRVSSKEQRR